MPKGSGARIWGKGGRAEVSTLSFYNQVTEKKVNCSQSPDKLEPKVIEMSRKLLSFFLIRHLPLCEMISFVTLILF